MKSTKIKLVIGERNVVLGHRSIAQVIDCIEDIQENAKVFEILAISSNLREVKKCISLKDSLTRKTVKSLLKENDHETLYNLLRNHKNAKFIKERELIRILQNGDIVHAESIADNLETYERCNIYRLAKILSKHPDPSVRMTLSDRWHTPKKILLTLTKDVDINVSNAAKRCLE